MLTVAKGCRAQVRHLVTTNGSISPPIMLKHVGKLEAHASFDGRFLRWLWFGGPLTLRQLQRA